MHVLLTLAFAFAISGCADDNPWSDDTRLVAELSDSERTEFCEDHADEDVTCSERSLREMCTTHVRNLANGGCKTVAQASDCYVSNDGCDALDCGFDCQAECLSVPLDECENKPGCTVRTGLVETENQCLQEVEAHCASVLKGCNNAPSYGEAPDGTCYAFLNQCAVPERWSVSLIDGPCYRLSELDRCE